MKFILSLTSMIMITSASVSAQDIIEAITRPSRLDMTPGYISINELNFGTGASDSNIPVSGFYFGVTTLHGYQINGEFSIAGGTGFLRSNERSLAPLFIDLRFNYYKSYSLSSYIFADGGLFADLSGDAGGAGLFLNPGAGVRYDYTDNTAFDLSFGLLLQKGSFTNSLINLKLGVYFKPGIISLAE